MALILMPLLFLLPEPLPSLVSLAGEHLPRAHEWRIVVPLVLGVATVVLLFTGRRFAVAAFVCGFSLVNASIAEPSVYGIRTPGYNRQLIESFRQGDRFTAHFDPTAAGILFWFGDEIVPTRFGPLHLASVFDSYVSSRGAWTANLLAEKSPGLPIARITREELPDGACLGLLTSEEAAAPRMQEMQRHFADMGRPLRLVGIGQFHRRDISFTLTVLKPIHEWNRNEEPRCVGGLPQR